MESTTSQSDALMHDVNTESQVAAMARMIQELQKDNTALKEENAALKEENAALKEENAALKEENAALKEESAALQDQADDDDDSYIRAQLYDETAQDLALATEDVARERRNAIEAERKMKGERTRHTQAMAEAKAAHTNEVAVLQAVHAREIAEKDDSLVGMMDRLQMVEDMRMDVADEDDADVASHVKKRKIDG